MVMNSLYAGYATKSVIEVGTGATLLSYSDRYPATVIATFDEKGKSFIHVQQDDYKRIDSNGMSESQEYEYTPNPDAQITTFRKEANGRWQMVRKNSTTKRWNKVESWNVFVGERERYYDFSF